MQDKHFTVSQNISQLQKGTPQEELFFPRRPFFNPAIKESLNKSLRTSVGSFSDCRCQIPLDVAMLRLRGLFLDSRKNPSTDARIDLISASFIIRFKAEKVDMFLKF